MLRVLYGYWLIRKDAIQILNIYGDFNSRSARDALALAFIREGKRREKYWMVQIGEYFQDTMDERVRNL